MGGSLVNRVGPWVVGDAFFGRDLEREQLTRLLIEGNHVSLAAQRRVGKTSLLHQVAADLEGTAICVYVDLQSASDEPDALVALATATAKHLSLRTRLHGAFSNVVGSVEELGVGGDRVSLKLREGLLGDWREKGRRICSLTPSCPWS